MRLPILLFIAACTSQRAAAVTLETPIALPTVQASTSVVLANGAPMPTLWGVSPGMTREEVTTHLGAAGARRLHYYLRRGVMVMEESGHVEVFDFFAPLDAARARKIAETVRPP